MTDLELPEELRGPWDNLLILTYGADIPFFENALWKQLRSFCRNRIILADGSQFLEACQAYARGAAIRHLNQRYIADGIHTPHAAHAKIILLTHPARGRALVGSGNLNLQGFASGGEIFTKYEFSEENPLHLAAFGAVREIIEHLVERSRIGKQAKRQLRLLLENTPWLYQKPPNDERPVRHNLEQPHLQQLVEHAAGQKIKRLTILSPFYDPKLVALKEMIDRLDPKQVRLLVQRGYTSMDQAQLEQFAAEEKGRVQVLEIHPEIANTYIHAKLYYLELASRDICLQGSPNLSQVAMLRTFGGGNLEVANLLQGPPGHFQELIDRLNPTPVESVSSMELTLATTATEDGERSEEWRLTSGEWRGDRLLLSYLGEAPALDGASLIIAGETHPLVIVEHAGNELEIELPEKAIQQLYYLAAVAVEWIVDSKRVTSNPIYPANRDLLVKELEMPAESEYLDDIGMLDLEDEELERLLIELESTLIFDAEGLWQLAGKRPQPGEGHEEGEEIFLDYSDIDYDLLRNHPKIKQYLQRKGQVQESEIKSRLQIILNSITAHFRDLSSGTTPVIPPGLPGDETVEYDAETIEEVEQEEAEKERKRTSIRARVRRLLNGFIHRYLKGLNSKEFQQMAGFEVMIQNYAIFVHILWRLFFNDWLEPDEIASYAVDTLEFFWGHNQEPGYLSSLDDADCSLALNWLEEQNSAAYLLAILYYSDYVALTQQRKELRLRLRDFFRHFMSSPPFELFASSLESAWFLSGELLPYDPPQPTEIVERLVTMIELENRFTFQLLIEDRMGFPHHTIHFERQTVMRPALQKEIDIDCLIIMGANALKTCEEATGVLSEWMRSEKLEFYRIHNPEINSGIYYDTHTEEGLYWSGPGGQREFVDIANFKAAARSWDKPIDLLRGLPEQIPSRILSPSHSAVPK